MNQHQRIEKYLDDFGSISPMEAFTDLGITKLATRVSEMIRDGARIVKTTENGVNRYGEKIHYVRYKKAGSECQIGF